MIRHFQYIKPGDSMLMPQKVLLGRHKVQNVDCTNKGAQTLIPREIDQEGEQYMISDRISCGMCTGCWSWFTLQAVQK